MSPASHPSSSLLPAAAAAAQEAAIAAPRADDRAPPIHAGEGAGETERRPAFEGAEDGVGGDGGARGRRSAWNISSNGLSEVGPVMGAVSWPALSESTRASPKLSSSDSLKSVSDGSISAPPGPAIASPLIKQNMNNPNPSSTPTPSSTSRQKHNPNHSNPMGRGGGGGGGGGGALANGGSPPPPPLNPQPTMEETPQPSPRNFRNRSNNSSDHGPRSGGSMPYTHGGADHHHPRGNRRGYNGGGGGGGSGGGFVNRRNYNFREAQAMPQPQLQHAPPPSFLRPPPPPPPPPPFMSYPPQVRPFMAPMGFPDIHSQMYYIPPYPPPFESLKNVGFVAHQVPPVMSPTMVLAPEDHQHALMKQIEYYFSSENLCKDLYLRQNMDDQGWVPISLIANFNRVKQLATNYPYILDTVRCSDMLEVEGEKIRRRNDWMNWVLPPSSNPYGSISGPHPPTPSRYDLAGHMQSLGLEEGGRNTSSSTRRMLADVSSSGSGSGRGNLNRGQHVGGPKRGGATESKDQIGR